MRGVTRWGLAIAVVVAATLVTRACRDAPTASTGALDSAPALRAEPARSARDAPASETVVERSDTSEPTAGPDVLVRVVVRDLADGEVPPELELTLPGGAAETILSTGDAEWLVPRSQWRDVEADGDRWQLVLPPRPEPSGAVRAWAYRVVRLRGRVILDSVPDGHAAVRAGDARLDVCPIGIDGATAQSPTPAPWNAPSLRALGVERAVRTIRQDDDGTFELEVPRCRALGVRAQLPGYRSAWAPILNSDGGVVDEVVLRLVRGLYVGGRVVDENGEPIVGVRVQVYATRVLRPNEVVPSRLAGLAQGATARISASRAIVSVKTEVVTDAEGEYQAMLEVGGHIFVHVQNRGYVPNWSELGERDTSVDGLDTVLRRANVDQKAALTRAGEPLVGWRVDLTDVTLGPVDGSRDGPQADMGAVRTDEHGHWPCYMLVPGRTYVLHAIGPNGESHPTVVDWGSATEFDIGFFDYPEKY